MHCQCGRQRVLAKGMCAAYYTLGRRDEVNVGRLRNAVLARDSYCRWGEYGVSAHLSLYVTIFPMRGAMISKAM